MNTNPNESVEAVGAGLLAGAARCDITPPIGAPLLCGFDDVAKSVGDPLFARVLYLEDAATHQAAVIVAIDVVGLTRVAHDEIRRVVAQAASIPLDRVVVNASHSHSAPYVVLEIEEIVAAHGYHVVDSTWFRNVVDRVGRTAAQARERREDVTISVGDGQLAELAFNRRLQYVQHADRPRFDKLRRYPLGVTDPELGVLRLDGANGAPVAIVCSFASHATVYAPHGVISGSYPGVAMSALEQEIGDSCVDVHSRLCWQHFSGTVLAQSLDRRRAGIRPVVCRSRPACAEL